MLAAALAGGSARPSGEGDAEVVWLERESSGKAAPDSSVDSGKWEFISEIQDWVADGNAM